MCYSAQLVEQNPRYLRETGARINLEAFAKRYGQQPQSKRLKRPRAMGALFDEPQSAAKSARLESRRATTIAIPAATTPAATIWKGFGKASSATATACWSPMRFTRVSPVTPPKAAPCNRESRKRTSSSNSGPNPRSGCSSPACGPTGPRRGRTICSPLQPSPTTPAEVAAAGHDRCIVPITAENLEAWLRPDGNRDRAQAILDERARPFYEHRMAA